MHVVLALLAVIFVIGGFVGFGLGGIPTIILWTLAALCIVAGWRSRPGRLRRREDRLNGPSTS